MLKQLLSLTVLTLAIGVCTNAGFAQTPPQGRATLLRNFLLPRVNIVFDQELDQNFGRGGSLDPNAQLISDAHRIAQQQVQVAIEFLEGNRSLILEGNSTEFNSIFGNPNRSTTNAVLGQRPLGGGELEVMNAAGQNPVYTITQDTDMLPANFGNNMRIGQRIFVAFDGSGVGGVFTSGIPQAPTLGFTALIEDIFAQQNGEEQVIVLDPQSIRVSNPSLLATITDADVAVWDVVDIVDRIDPTLYDQVLNTYRKIRLALQGFEPNPTNASQNTAPIQRDIEYFGEFRDFNSVWAPGVATAFPGAQFFGYPADRRLRQAGFSNSDSLDHIRNLQGSSGQAPNPPLLWTADNSRQIDNNSIVGVLPNGTLVGTLLGDESRPFFNDRQTLFSVPDNPHIQYVGRAFLEERIQHIGSFRDDSIAGTGSTQRLVPALDANGNLQFDSNGILQQTLVNLGENTTSQDGDTPLVRWQMVLESFAEFDSNFNDQTSDSAFIGLSDLSGGTGANSAIQVRDAANFAQFANLFRGLEGGGRGGLGPIRPEPQGKRATAGSSDFNPVIPLF